MHIVKFSVLEIQTNIQETTQHMNYALQPEESNNKGYPFEMHRANQTSRNILAHNVLPTCPNVLIVYTVHDTSTPDCEQNVEAITIDGFHILTRFCGV